MAAIKSRALPPSTNSAIRRTSNWWRGLRDETHWLHAIRLMLGARRQPGSRGPDAVEEFADLKLQPVGFVGQRSGCAENLRRGASGFDGATFDLGNVGRDFHCSGGSLLNVAGDFLGSRPLLFDGRCYAGGDFRNPADDTADFLHLSDGILRRRLYAGDLLADFGGRLGGLLGQSLDLGCYHRKATTGLARTRGFDRRIESQQIGLARDGINEFDDIADLRRSLRQ